MHAIFIYRSTGEASVLFHLGRIQMPKNPRVFRRKRTVRASRRPIRQVTRTDNPWHRIGVHIRVESRPIPPECPFVFKLGVGRFAAP